MKINLIPLDDPQDIAGLWAQVCEGIKPTPAIAFGPEWRDHRPRRHETYYLAFDDEHLSDGRACGAGAVGLVWTQRPAPTTMTFAIALFPLSRGQGYGILVDAAAIAHCFGDPEIHKVEGEIYSGNTHSIVVRDKHGHTTPEGRQRATICIDGTYYDRLLFGLTREEWEAATR